MPLKCLPTECHLKITLGPSNSSQQDDDQILRHCENPNTECVLFHVAAVGRNIKKILKVKELRVKGSKLCICAYKGMTIKEALCKDGRFRSDLNELEWNLREGHNNIHGKESLVDDVSGKVLEMEISGKTSVEDLVENPEQQNENVTDEISPSGVIPSNSEVWDSESDRETEDVENNREKRIQSQRPSNDIEEKNRRTQAAIIQYYNYDSSAKINMRQNSRAGQRPCLHRQRIINQHILEDAIILWQNNLQKLGDAIMQQYPNFNKVPLELDKYFKEERDRRKMTLPKQFKVYEEDFGKETANSNSVATYKRLLPFSESVGLIKWDNNGNAGNATGFHLKGGYVMTCLHVVCYIVGESTHPFQWPDIIRKCAKITFTYEGFCPTDDNWFSFESLCEEYDGNLDYVILKLKANGKAFPPGLCGQISPLPYSGLVYLIGHPGGENKKIDDCAVIPVNERPMKYAQCQDVQPETNCAINEACPMFTRRSFQSVILSTDMLSYDTSFSSGSSGSPVFTTSGSLVAMHAFGHFYKPVNKTYALVEYGYSIDSIMCDIRRKNECFHKFLLEENENHSEGENEKQGSSRQHQTEPMECI